MKITIYELLGMIKDGKAPKEIKYCDEIFTFNNDDCNFLYKYQVGKCQLFGCCKLNDTVEIIEEKKIPEKLGTYTITDETISGMRKSLNTMINIDIIGTINEIIDYLKSKGE